MENSTSSMAATLSSTATSTLAMAAPLSTEASYFATRNPLSLKDIGLLRNQRTRRLRAAAQAATIRGAATSWIDQDDSGTYDPNLEEKTQSPKRNIWAKKLKNEHDESESESETEKKERNPKNHSSIVTFTFTTKPGLDYLRSLPVDLQSGLKDSTESEEDDVDTAVKYDSESELDDSVSVSKSQEKIHEKVKQSSRSGINTRQDGLTLNSIPATNPIVRGCKACFYSSYDDCSLMTDKQSYPCESCHDADLDCELIIPPKLKKVCQPCKRNKIFCSYRDDGGLGKDSCDACTDEGISCAAAPLDPDSRYAKRFSTANESEPNNEEEDENQIGKRVFTKCNQCRQKGQNCSLRSKNDQGPCTSCREINDTCRFVMPYLATRRIMQQTPPPVDSPRKRKRKEAARKTARKKMLQRERAIRKLINSRTKPSKITTSFCNPINFNYTPALEEEETQLCHFCTDPFFGLTGNEDDSGPRIVEGRWLPHGRGFQEVKKSSHSKVHGPENRDNKEQTRMCIPCTTARISIFSCAAHLLIPIEIQIPDSDAYNHAAQSLAEDNFSDDNLILNAKFCSVCPSIAHFQCGTGCGLYLCETCADIIFRMQERGMEKGNETLDCLVREVISGGWKYPSGPRADASFLTSSGELITRLRAGMSQPIPSLEVEEKKITGEEESELADLIKLSKEQQHAGIKRRRMESDVEGPILRQKEAATKGKARQKQKSFKNNSELDIQETWERELYKPQRHPDLTPARLSSSHPRSIFDSLTQPTAFTQTEDQKKQSTYSIFSPHTSSLHIPENRSIINNQHTNSSTSTPKISIAFARLNNDISSVDISTLAKKIPTNANPNTSPRNTPHPRYSTSRSTSKSSHSQEKVTTTTPRSSTAASSSSRKSVMLNTTTAEIHGFEHGEIIDLVSDHDEEDNPY